MIQLALHINKELFPINLSCALFTSYNAAFGWPGAFRTAGNAGTARSLGGRGIMC